MTQLDLPPISLARYLDLLKRRRWQVIPVTIAGLVLGALIAFFIPRYYVVGTKLRFNSQAAVISDAVPLEDALMGELDNARFTIPAAVEGVLRELQWPEALSQDLDQRHAFVNAVRERIEVKDLSPTAPGGRGRKYLNLGITYRDTDGFRALELVKKLTDSWLEREKKRLLEDLGQLGRKLHDDRNRAAQALQSAQRDKQLFEVEHRINPEDWKGPQARGDVGLKTQRVHELQKKLTELKPELKELANRRTKLRDQRETTPKEVARTTATAIDPKVKAQLEYLYLLLMGLEKRLVWVTEAHPMHPLWKRQRDEAAAAYAMAQELARTQATEMIPNPAWEKLQDDIEDVNNRLLRAEENQAAWTFELEKLEIAGKTLPEVYTKYEQKLAAVRTADDEVVAIDKELIALDARLRTLDSRPPYEPLELPYLPPRPTDPNITLVALTGSLLGLGAAIVLILLLDMMRTTFKTIDDVGRGLPVPVLGGISYMDTIEQRAAVGARRTKISLVAFAFLILIVAIVVLYYVAPARLPKPVFDVLELLLGEPK